NFYPGKMSPSKNTETIVDLENIENLNSEECLSYGKDEYFILTYKEIDVSIKATKNVVTPLGKEIVFTDFNIKKLLWFCNKPKKSQESSKIYEIRKSIYATIIGLSEVSDTSNLILQKMQEDKSGTNA